MDQLCDACNNKPVDRNLPSLDCDADQFWFCSWECMARWAVQELHTWDFSYELGISFEEFDS